ncbi:unnamed protein product [Polarella glacialis]|uniref:Peroxisomal membrane protein MPV17 n=1 Tax=Polarella glacialis TaxID=89957 RepID=A0A813H8S4_POLGL|nr:unnamed protein product [Polarella glacialis]|mmetsp:Transcript_52627/g.85293  ORF Transcript_52627/g.85293 Transcript_52627/m.85293 type:complete len:183 (-) Transcript_52627:61-609(-)
MAAADQDKIVPKRSDVPVWGAYLRALERAPLRTKALTSVFIMAAAQATSQKISLGAIQDKRSVRIWCLWGFVISILNHHWQNFIAKQGPSNLFAKIAVDHAVYKMPILYAFVTYERWMKGAGLKDAWGQSVAANPALQRTSVKIFPLIQILNFTMVPLPLRVLYMNSALFFWCIYLALKLKV